MNHKIRIKLNTLISKDMEDKYFPNFEKMASFVGNGIYTINGLYAPDTRELFLMYCAQQEGIDYENIENKPKMLPDNEINLNPLKEMLQSCIDDIWSDDYSEDNDDSQYVYETAMTTFFGEDVWDKINKQTS